MTNPPLLEEGVAKFKHRVVQDTPQIESHSESEDSASQGSAQCSRASSSTPPPGAVEILVDVDDAIFSPDSHPTQKQVWYCFNLLCV